MAWFCIKNEASGRVLDISESTHGENLIIYDQHGGDNQLWRLNENGQLESKTGLVADITENGGSGTNVIGWPSNDQPHQQWYFANDCCYSQSDNNLVLDIFEGGTDNDTPVIVYPYHGGPNQVWRFVDAV